MQFSSWLEPSDHQELHPTRAIGISQGAAPLAAISDQPLKVTLLASEWGSAMGGLSTLNKKLAIFLAKHSQVDVTVLVPQYACSEEDKRHAKEHNVAIQEAKKLPGYADPLDWLGFLPEGLATDIVLGHGVKLGKQVQIIRKTHHCRWIQVVHSAPEELGVYKDYPRAIAKGQEKNEDEVELCKLANLVVAVGPKLTETYSSYLRSCKKHQDIFRLTPGVFHEFSTVEQVTEEGKTFKVLIFGRGDLEDFVLKGYDTAAKAVALLGSSYRLVFVGASEGKEEEVAQKLLQSGGSECQLIVRTFVKSEEKIKELFCEVDLAIMPSRTDGFGLTALEALSAGLPILVSSNSGFGEALRELPTGKSHLVESHDPTIWANAIASVRQKDRAQRLLEVQALRADYEKKYSWEDQCGDLVKKMLGMAHGPPEILARGPLAVDAYNKALADGKTSVKRVPIMIIGQDRAGKTSLKKSLKGICFDPEEDSTIGIDVDPSHFKMTTKTWRTGTKKDNQNADVEISFYHHAATWIVDNIEKESESSLFEISEDEIESTSDFDVSVIPKRPGPSGETRRDDTANSQPEFTVNKDASQLSSRPSEQNQEPFDNSSPCVPEAVATVTEKLLQGGWRDSRNDIYSIVWDFSGQSVYYETHPIFLTVRAIYCLVYDLSLNPRDTAKPVVKQGVCKTYQDSFMKTNLDYLDFWMMSVASLASNQSDDQDVRPKSEILPDRLPAVFLVCTHADKPYEDRDSLELAREIFGCLKSKPYGAHLHDLFVVDNTKSGTDSECLEVVRLRQKVLAVAKDLPHINETIPIKWLKFEQAMNALKEKRSKYISLEVAKHIASTDCNIKEDKEAKLLIDYLHDLRSLIHFNDPPELNKLVVLDPQWLIDVFKKVITVRPCDCKEKKFVAMWRKLETEGILDEELLTHVWGNLCSSNESRANFVGIMEKFSLLCPWPSETSKSFIVPSMLKTHPVDKVLYLVTQAKIPSLFIKFQNGSVPSGFFCRFVLQFFQWGTENFFKPVKPELFRNFARFFTYGGEVSSVIFVCHTSSVEVVVVAEDDHDTAIFTCADVVCWQVGLMLESMRNEFHWLSNMRYEMSVLCPACCQGGAIVNCHSHDCERCNQEQCLHFWSLSELFSAKETVICTKSSFAQNIKVHTKEFAPWFPSSGHQLTGCERERNNHFPGNGQEKTPLTLPDKALESLSCPSHDPIQIVRQLTESLAKEVVVRGKPDTEAKAMIRCFARIAKHLNRLDVVKHLRENAPAGTTGHEEKALALSSNVLESLSCLSNESKEVVAQFTESLQLEQASPEEPNSETKALIRSFSRNALRLKRPDVVKRLRELLPAGTTGPLLCEHLVVQKIPLQQLEDLTHILSAGDEWKRVAEKLGLTPDKIRYLDKRVMNPADTFLAHLAKRRHFTVGELYDILCECGFPVLADKL